MIPHPTRVWTETVEEFEAVQRLAFANGYRWPQTGQRFLDISTCFTRDGGQGIAFLKDGSVRVIRHGGTRNSYSMSFSKFISMYGNE